MQRIFEALHVCYKTICECDYMERTYTAFVPRMLYTVPEITHYLENNLVSYGEYVTKISTVMPCKVKIKKGILIPTRATAVFILNNYQNVESYEFDLTSGYQLKH